MNNPEVFVIPGLPPTTNHGYGLSTKSGKAIMYKTQAAKDWQEAASLIINASKRRQDWAKCDIAAEIHFTVNNRNRDVDGGVKVVLDTVAEALGFNDKRVVNLVVWKIVNRKVPEETRIDVIHWRWATKEEALIWGSA